MINFFEGFCTVHVRQIISSEYCSSVVKSAWLVVRTGVDVERVGEVVVMIGTLLVIGLEVDTNG